MVLKNRVNTLGKAEVEQLNFTKGPQQVGFWLHHVKIFLHHHVCILYPKYPHSPKLCTAHTQRHCILLLMPLHHDIITINSTNNVCYSAI